MMHSQLILAAAGGASSITMILLALPACAIWAVLYFIPIGSATGADAEPDREAQDRADRMKRILSPVRIAVGTGALRLVAAAAETMIILATDWPIWILAALGAICVDIIVLLYSLERRTVSPRAGMAMCGMRAALVLGVIIMLAQPTWSAAIDESSERSVAVLIDNSGSMHLPEIQMTEADKARLVEMFGIAKRPMRLDMLHAELRTLGDDLESWRRFAAEISVDRKSIGRRLAARRHSIRKTANDWADKLAAHVKESASPDTARLKLSAGDKARLGRVRTALSSVISTALKTIADITEESDQIKLAGAFDELRKAITDAATATANTAAGIPLLADKIDTLFYTAMKPETRKRLDILAGKTRFGLARDVLLSEGAAGRETCLLDLLSDKFAVSLYKFAARPQELNVRKFAESTGAHMSPATRPDKLPEDMRLTDISAALAEMMPLSDSGRLTGVIVLSDARHTAKGRPESYARSLAQAGAPIYPVIIGSDIPPPDAAAATVSSPESISPGDELLVEASCKFDGLAGKTVHVTLTDGDREVDSKTLTLEDSDQIRKRIRMSDKPAMQGLHVYKLRIDPLEGEIDDGNNEFSFSVNVTDGDTNLLIVEDRPRWEYRYVKNLFLGRDKAVKLQHVLLQPDRITGEPDRPVVHASASRPREAPEATALPRSKEQWLKFDVIILGDLPPSVLDEKTLEILKEFVSDRGGTVVFIAGRGYMPHTYGRTVLAELLPIRFIPDVATRMPESAFRIGLTPAGRNHIVTRQDTDPKINERIWASLPAIHWRRPIIDAKPGAAVLAYAKADDEPTMEDASTPAERTAQMARIVKYRRSRALISTHNVGTGSVMFMSFDRTWRMRYRVGDTHHHKLWGQILRWATSDRLRSGTNLVKLGTDRSRYGVESPVRIRANLIDRDLAPIKGANVTIELFRAGKLVLRRKMPDDDKSPGRYFADLGRLPGGAYRAVLGGDTVAKILAEEGQADSVETEFSVDSTLSAEQVELTADRGMAQLLADRSGGRVFEANQAKQIVDLLAARKDEQELPAQFPLWDSWWLLIALLALAGGEWLTRKRAGLT